MNDTDVVKLKFQNSVTGINKLEQYEQKLKSIKTAIDNLPSGISITSDDVKNADDLSNKFKDSSKNSGNLKKALSSASIIAFGKGLQSVVQSMSKYTSVSADYVENLNLMNVAYHRLEDSTDEASLAGEKLVNTLSEMYGLDESSLTRTVGIFKQLSNAMGVSDELGNRLTKTLTQMSIDVSSLYNVSFERAVSVLQSSLAGQTKPIRGLAGGDITETTLQMTLETIGIDRSIRDLSYVEKRLVIVISLLNQLNESQNDYGKTINSVSNQMRMFNEQTQRLARAIGNVFLPILQKILPYINGVMMVLTELINMLAEFLGFDEDMLAGFAENTDDMYDFGASMDSANDSAKKLKQGLRGFDKLNVITTPSSASAGISAGGLDADIIEAFNKASEEYDKKLESIKTKASVIRDTIMEWLGYEKQVDTTTGKVSWKFKKITGGTILGALAIGGTIYKGITGAFKILEKIGIIKFPSLEKLVSTFSIIFPNAITGISTLFTNLVSVISSFATMLSTPIAIITGIGVAIVFLHEKFGILNGAIKVCKEFIGDISSNFSNLKGEIINGVLSAFEDFIESVNSIKKELSPLKDMLTSVVDVIKVCIDIFKKLVIETGILESVFTVFTGVALVPFRAGFEFAFGAIKTIVVTAIDTIGAVLGTIAGVIDGVIKIIKGIATGNWKKAWEGFTTVISSVFNGLVKILKTPINAIIGFAETMVNAVISGVNGAIKALNKVSVKIPDWVPKYGGEKFGISIKTVEKAKFQRLETGMDFVPRDFYGPVYLDYGERVLTKEENAEYMKGNTTLNTNNIQRTSVSPTIIVKVGDEEIARKVLNNLQDMATANGQVIEIGG